MNHGAGTNPLQNCDMYLETDMNKGWSIPNYDYDPKVGIYLMSL